MTARDTIVACSSPPGRSACAIVRASGAGVRKLAAALIDPPDGPACARAMLRLTDVLRLPVVVLRYFAPASYTGEDSLELLIPGNPTLVERVLSRLCETPHVRPAGPGEFSARAYLNAKLSVNEAEGVAAMIAAEDAEELSAAAMIRSGRRGERYDALRETIASCLALVEAGIDFTDQEDVVAIEASDLRSRLLVMREEVRRLIGSDTPAALREAPRVALVGEPNAGKSTLFNALLGRRRAVASPEAGTTRDAIEETLDLSRECPGAGRVVLADLPGLDQNAASPLGKEAQRAARDWLADADLLIWCDPRGEFGHDPGAPCIGVRTRADQPGGAGREDLRVCALDGYNIVELRHRIGVMAWRGRARGVAALIPRHLHALERTLDALDEALGAGENAPELVAAGLRRALDEVGELAGRLTPDDVLGRIFAGFCIGK